MADACLSLMGLADAQFEDLAGTEPAALINIGCGQDPTIRELAETVTDVLIFDACKPDGTPRKLLDCSRFNSLGWQPATPLRAGLEKVCQSFQQQHRSVIAS